MPYVHVLSGCVDQMRQVIYLLYGCRILACRARLSLQRVVLMVMCLGTNSASGFSGMLLSAHTC
eukprot:5947034-Heterocapsa_arctica.AAC.1